MIIQCEDCKTRYQLDPERVPRESIRVRCPKCRYVFSLDREEHSAPAARVEETPSPVASAGGFREIDLRSGPVQPPEPAVAPSPTPEPAVAQPPTPEPVAARVEPTPVAPENTEPSMTPPSPAAPEEAGSLDLEIERSSVAPMRGAGFAAEPEASAPTAVATAPEQDTPSASEPVAEEASPEQDKSRRLARALVSDILVYNRELRDKALQDGNLVQALGQEIKKSWELYKEKVTPEVANSNNHFREALNDILADGQQIF